MPVVTESVRIAAPADAAFRVLSELERQPERFEEVQSMEYLSEGGFTGVGTRIREVRAMSGGQTLATELEVIEYDPEARVIRMVADTHGTIWDTRMSVAEEEGGCRVTFAMDARGQTWLKRAMNVVMQGFFRRGIREHLKHLRTLLEAT